MCKIYLSLLNIWVNILLLLFVNFLQKYYALAKYLSKNMVHFTKLRKIIYFIMIRENNRRKWLKLKKFYFYNSEENYLLIFNFNFSKSVVGIRKLIPVKPNHNIQKCILLTKSICFWIIRITVSFPEYPKYKNFHFWMYFLIMFCKLILKA